MAGERKPKAALGDGGGSVVPNGRCWCLAMRGRERRCLCVASLEPFAPLRLRSRDGVHIAGGAGGWARRQSSSCLCPELARQAGWKRDDSSAKVIS